MFNQDKHRTVMYRLLTGMFRDPYLSAVLGFKGGTACYFFHGLPRFSVDLDFDIVTRQYDDAVCNEVHAKLRELVKAGGLIVRDELVKRNTVFVLASYALNERTIKIEVSRRDWPNTYEMLDFYGQSVRVLTRPDMFAHKLVAALDRKKTASRDFFDIWFFFKQAWPINEEIVRLRTGKDLKNYLVDLRGFIQQNLNSRTLMQGLGEVIDEKQKTWVKNRFKDELIGVIGFTIDA